MQNALDYISIKGFRSIREEKLELHPINILVGANGSGKSNVVSVFSFLNELRRGNLRSYTEQRGGANRILHFGSKVTSTLEIKISFSNSVNGYNISLTSTDIDTFSVRQEKCWYWKSESYREPMYFPLTSIEGEAGISKELSRTPGWVQKRLDSWRIYHFHDTSDSSPMKRIADIDDNQFLRPDGSNLPSYLLFLKEKHPSDYRLIRNMVRRVTPFLDDFQLAPSRRNEDKIRLEWSHKSSSDQYFDVSSLSDGTLRFICLATLLLQPHTEYPSTILLDEPELGLHPYAISMLANMVKSASTETQVIISTQSPILLESF